MFLLFSFIFVYLFIYLFSFIFIFIVNWPCNALPRNLSREALEGNSEVTCPVSVPTDTSGGVTDQGLLLN